MGHSAELINFRPYLCRDAIHVRNEMVHHRRCRWLFSSSHQHTESWGCQRMSEKFIQSHVFHRKNVRPAMNSISFSLLFLLRVPKIILIFHPICFALELKAWAKGRVKENLIVSGEWVDIPGMINYFQFIFLIFSSSSSALLPLFHHLECLPMRLQRCAWFESGRNFIIFQFSSVFPSISIESSPMTETRRKYILHFETFQLIEICKNLLNFPSFLDKSVRVRFQSAKVFKSDLRWEVEQCSADWIVLLKTFQDSGYHCRIEWEIQINCEFILFALNQK